MSSSKDIEHETHTHPVDESPGRMVAKAREAASISAPDLALRLRLDTRVIKALERDDFENLPAPMFVKGYIRSIAKELNVDSESILAAYESHTSVEPPSLADFSSRAPDQVGINSTSIKIVTYGLAALLVILIALWGRANFRDGETLQSPASPADPYVDAATPLPYSFDIVEHETPGWQNVAPPAPVAETDAASTTEPVDVAALAAPASAAMDTHTLSVETDSEAWVEIYAHDDTRLYFGMARAGRTVELAEQPYFRLILGNTDSISLRFDGELVDLRPYARQGVAQLELGTKNNAGEAASP